MIVTEEIIAQGHPLIQAIHKTTLEITKDSSLTRRGDCIVAVRASKACINLSQSFRDAIKNPVSVLHIIIEAGREKEVIVAKGDPRLLLSNNKDIVIRKSNYICGRTLGINSNKSAYDLSRTLIRKTQNADQKIRITLSAQFPDKSFKC